MASIVTTVTLLIALSLVLHLTVVDVSSTTGVAAETDQKFCKDKAEGTVCETDCHYGACSSLGKCIVGEGAAKVPDHSECLHCPIRKCKCTNGACHIHWTVGHPIAITLMVIGCVLVCVIAIVLCAVFGLISCITCPCRR